MRYLTPIELLFRKHASFELQVTEAVVHIVQRGALQPLIATLQSPNLQLNILRVKLMSNLVVSKWSNCTRFASSVVPGRRRTGELQLYAQAYICLNPV
ncbi:hypothetical protein C5167_036107 [Papaver somniferum]|nr:hypothetical protein C5167_036107 [Papaver somniferum]